MVSSDGSNMRTNATITKIFVSNVKHWLLILQSTHGKFAQLWFLVFYVREVRSAFTRLCITARLYGAPFKMAVTQE